MSSYLSSAREDVRRATWRSWAGLTAGTLFLGTGIAMTIESGRGAAPYDAFISGVAFSMGWPVGMTSILISFILVTLAAAVGVRPGIGTLLSFVATGFVIDATMLAVPSPSGLTQEWAYWAVGALLLPAGAAFLIANGLGASPYDQVTLAAAKVTRRVWTGRALVDVLSLTGGIILGGAWGWGTGGLLIVVPLVLRFGLPVAQRWCSTGAKVVTVVDELPSTAV